MAREIVLEPTWESVGPMELHGTVQMEIVQDVDGEQARHTRPVFVVFQRSGDRETSCVGILHVHIPNHLHAALDGIVPVMSGVHGLGLKPDPDNEGWMSSKRFSTASCDKIFDSVGQRPWTEAYRDAMGPPVVEEPVVIIEADDGETDSQDEAPTE